MVLSRKLTAVNARRRRRLEALLRTERSLWERGFARVAGVDEAGVGPLAGPVVAAAVIFPAGEGLSGVDDSKRLEPQEREELAERVRESALAWALQQHLIAGAALDVYENEPAIHPDLLPLENVLLVPHLGSGTTETRTAMADRAVQNVVAVLSGRAPVTAVRHID